MDNGKRVILTLRLVSVVSADSNKARKLNQEHSKAGEIDVFRFVRSWDERPGS